MSEVNGLAEFDAYTEGIDVVTDEVENDETTNDEVENEAKEEEDDEVNTDDKVSESQDEESEDEEKEEEESESEETETEKDEEALTPEETIEALRAQLAEALAAKDTTQVVETKEDKEPETKTEVVDEIPNYVASEGFDKIFEDPKEFNKVIHNAIQQGIKAHTESIQLGAVETIQTSIPNIIATQIEQREVLNKAAQEFYTDHKELEPYRPVVANNINAVAAEHPDWTLEKIMPEAAARSYKQLKLNARATEGVTNADAKTTGLRKGGKRGKRASTRNKTEDTRTQLQKELDAL